MKNNKKLNEGCLKIFQLLELLYEDKADYDSVISIFKDEFADQSTNNIQVILNKNMNALKVFGIKVIKENNKYKMLSSLYSMPFTLDDLKAISIITNSIKEFPDEEIDKNILSFINNIQFRMGNEDKNTLNNLSQNRNYDFSFYYSNIKDQVEQCQKICKEGFIINVFYISKGQEISCKCTPQEVLYDTKNAYLKVYDTISRQNLEIPITNILSIAKLPQIAKKVEMTTTVVYKLKNRLAQTYKLKETETSEGLNANGELIVINKGEPFDKLLQRLMRYLYNCEIVSPKNLREEMIKLINETLNNYKI